MTGKNRRKQIFPREGKSKIGENWLSLTGENQKSAKIDFPNIGKTRNQQKTAFPTLGKQEISENRLSQHWENKKSAKIGFPNIGKNKKCHWLHFPTLGETKNPESLLSDFRGSVHFDTSSFLYPNLYSNLNTGFTSSLQVPCQSNPWTDQASEWW